MSGVIYREQQVLWEGKSAKKAQDLSSQILTPPSLINSHFPSSEHPGGAFLPEAETGISLDLQAPGAGGCSAGC